LLTVTGEEPSPVKMILGKTGSIRGRAVNKSMEPLAEVACEPFSQRTSHLFQSENLGKPKPKTDKDGRFQFDNLIPQLPIEVRLTVDGKGLHAKLTDEQQPQKPGQEIDLGDVVFAPPNQRLPAQNEIADPPAAPPKDPPADGEKEKPPVAADATSIRGAILGFDGKPVANADVALIGFKIQPQRGGELASNSDVLKEAMTDASGRFAINIPGLSSKTHSRVHLIARKEGFGLVWKRIDPDARDFDVTLEMPAEKVIRGRFIDIEGQPVAGVRMSVNSIVQATKSDVERDSGIGYRDLAKPPQAWPNTRPSDETGRFAIHGIPAENGVSLKVEGTDRIARQDLSINTGWPEERPKNDGTYRPLVRNFKPDEECVLPLAPAQVFEGVVRYADTNEPAPNARLTIWASQQERSGSMISVAGKADAQGRYRINPMSGVRFGITAYPPQGTPYLIRELRDIKHNEQSYVKQVDIALPRGVLVRGHIVESAAKTPVATAVIQYVPETATRAKAPDDVITGWQGIQLSRDDGAFEIAVLPGPGTLLVNGPGGNFVAQEIGSQQLAGGRPGGERNYAHGIHRLTAEANAGPLDVSIELKRGATVSGRITDGTGKSVERAILITRLNLHPSELTWRGFPLEALGGRFELSGLAADAEYPVHFLDAKNRLGATVQLKADELSPTAVLVPCGEAVATFVDGEGRPAAGFRANLEIVITPGSPRLNLAAMRMGILAADAAFVANVDRTNYWNFPVADGNGKVTFPALIPGARYRIITYFKGMPLVLKEFVGESQQTLDLGTLTIEIPKDE
jgi:hypothetical protein